MNFPGQPPKELEAPAPLRTYEIVIDDIPDKVEADYVSFYPGYVSFWKNGKSGAQDTLVTAISNRRLDELKEVEA